MHTSPALFTVERFMQGFRARSQLLVERLDDEDEVLHAPFPEETPVQHDDLSALR